MPILADDIREAMRAVVDDEGTQRYLPDQDIIPGINAAGRRFRALVGAVFAQNKGGEELFSEITFTRVFQTNAAGGFILSEAQLGHKVWSVVAIYPEAGIEPSPSVDPVPTTATSLYRPDLYMRHPGDFPCRRITMEQIAQTRQSRSLPGNERLAAGPRRSWAYAIVGDRSSSTWLPGDKELILAPESIAGSRLIAVAYLRGVDPITTLADTLPYPDSAFQMIRDLALNEISLKQGAQPLYNVTIAEVRTLLGVQA